MDAVSDKLSFEYTTKSISSIYNEFLKNPLSCNLNPSYQRAFKWNSEKQNLFIDTICNGYLIPPLIILKLKAKQEYKFECIDGQHRLKTLKAFIEHKPVISTKPHIPHYTQNDLKIFYPLEIDSDEPIKAKVDDFQMCICLVKLNDDLSDDDKLELLQDLFLRLQNGQPVGTLDKLKNINHQIIKVMKTRKYSLFNAATYTADDGNINKMTQLIVPSVEKRYPREDSHVNTFSYIIIKTILIINYKSLYIGSYSSSVILNEFYGKKTQVYIRNISAEQVKHSLVKFFKFLNDFILALENRKVHEYLFYVLVYLYHEQNEKYTYYISKLNKLTKLGYSKTATYNEKFRNTNGKPKAILHGEELKSLINVHIDTAIKCPIKTKLEFVNPQTVDDSSDDSE